MCLTALTSKQTEDVEGEGWKIVKANLDSFDFTWQRYSRTFPYNTWIERESKRDLTTELDDPYPCGFHIFPSIEDAQFFYQIYNCQISTIVKVKYKTILAKGTQQGVPVIVTQFINVPQPEEKTKCA